MSKEMTVGELMDKEAESKALEEIEKLYAENGDTQTTCGETEK